MRSQLTGLSALLAALPFVPLHAQTGPGGIGDATSNFLWLDAGEGVTLTDGAVSAWADRSGNGNHALQTSAALRPTLAANVMNGRPALLFDNDNTNHDLLKIADNNSLDSMSALSAFCVYRLASGTANNAPRGILSKRNSPDNQESYAWFIYNGGSGSTTRTQTLDIDGTEKRLASSAAVSDNVDLLHSFVFKGSSPSNAQNQVLYNGNTAVGNREETSRAIPNYGSDLYVGSLYGHTGTGASATRFNGHMCELICYRIALNEAQRIIVNNYLAAKYGLSLASGDLYTQDDPANGDFDLDVAGIGRTTGSNAHTDSRGTGVVEISAPTGLDDNEFLFWGSDNGNLGTYAVGDKPAGVLGRWQRTWKVSEVTTAGAATDVGAVDITFLLDDMGSVTASDLRLIVDRDKDGTFADDAAISGATLVGPNAYRFSGVTALTHGVRFTLGTSDPVNTPLPIELLSFSATPAASGAVSVRWSTASEQDNAFFTVERSADLAHWDDVATLAGAGNSSAVLSYGYEDEAPLFGTSYYRLRQTDLDGSSTRSDVVAVERRAADAVIAYPNPAHDAVQVWAPSLHEARLVLLDALGRPVLPAVSMRSGMATIDVTGLPKGLYHLRSADGSWAGTYRLLVD